MLRGGADVCVSPARLALGSGRRIFRWRDSEGEVNVNRSIVEGPVGEGGEGVSDFLFLCASSALSASRVAAVTVEIWSLGLLGMRVGVRTYIHNLGPRRGRELL